MSRALLSFLGGMGAGAMEQRDKNIELERRERLDAQSQQLFDAKMDDIKREKEDRAALAAAGKDADVNESATTLDTGDGPKVYDLGPESADIAASDARQFSRFAQPAADSAASSDPAAAEIPVQPAAFKPVIGSTYAVNGVSYDKPAGLKAAASYNSPEARAARIEQALYARGKPTEAMQAAAASKAGKLSDIQLKAAQTAEAREAYNNQAMASFRENGVFGGAAKMLTETGAGGQEGITAQAVPTADGKFMEFYKTAPDGTKSLAYRVTNDRAGELDVITKMLQVPSDRLVEWHIDAQKRAVDTERWNKEFAQRDRQNASQLEISRAQVGISGGHLLLAKQEEGRRQKAFEQENKIPAAVKASYASLEKAAESIDKALNAAEAQPGSNMADPGIRNLQEKRARLSVQMSNLLSPYIPTTDEKAGQASSNRLNLTPPGATPAAAPAAVKPKITAADLKKAASGFPVTQ